MRGLGSAWTYTDIFKANSKQLSKNAQEAKDREQSLADNMYNDLAKASGGEYWTSLQVSGPGTSSADLRASQLLCECTHPRHAFHGLGDKKFFLHLFMPLVIMCIAAGKMQRMLSVLP